MRPTPLTLWLAAFWGLAALAASIWPALHSAWLWAGVALAVIALADAMLAWRPPTLKIEREMSASWPVGVWQHVTLKISNGEITAKRTLHLTLFDHTPAQCRFEALPAALSIPPGQFAKITYRARAEIRGNLQFGQTGVRLHSPFRLWERQFLAGVAQGVRVYPNFAAIAKFALLATDNRLSQIGVLQRRRRGEGLDFHQLREYREGDAQRQIDWKATSRMKKLISREYRDERDQQIFFLLDCGRRMAGRERNADDLELSHFDHALNATLLLAYAALRQGDAVGFATFGTEEPRFQAPRKSGATVTSLLNALYDLQPGLQSPDYYTAATSLSKRLKKRALIIVISNLRDEDDDTLSPALKLLGERHLVLFASLKERAVDDVLAERVTRLASALTHVSARIYARQRAQAFERVARHGALTLDIEPAKLPIALVNRYLEIKKTGRL